MTEKSLLLEMFRLHEVGGSVSIAFANENYEGLKNLWEQELSCYQVTKKVSGRVQIRRIHLGVLTPAGVEKAKSL